MSFFLKSRSESQYLGCAAVNNQHFEFKDLKEQATNAKYKISTATQSTIYKTHKVFDIIFDGMPDPMFVTSPTGLIRSVNMHAENVFGYRKSEIVGQNISLFFTPEFLSTTHFGYNAGFVSGKWRALTNGAAQVVRRKSNEILSAEVFRCDAIIDATPSHIYKVNDRSEVLRLEERIAQSDREIALLSRQGILGELTAAITHELSQPLTAIASYTAAAKNYYAKTGETRNEDGLELISKAGIQAQRAWQIIQRLRTLLQHRENEQKEADLRSTVEDAVELATLGATVHGVEIRTSLPKMPVIVMMDTVQIQILLANLIRNAIDELRVSSGKRIIKIALKLTTDDTAEVSVADTGPGIAQHVYEDIFDPFLTTKPEGLGVGLAVSRRIAQAHRGRLAARNLDEGGAEFSFIIPVSVSKRVKNE